MSPVVQSLRPDLRRLVLGRSGIARGAEVGMAGHHPGPALVIDVDPGRGDDPRMFGESLVQIGLFGLGFLVSGIEYLLAQFIVGFGDSAIDQQVS